MTKQEYIDYYYNTDGFYITDLVEKVWNEACDKMLEKINKVFLIDEKDLSKEEILVFQKTIEKINKLKKPILE